MPDGSRRSAQHSPIKSASSATREKALRRGSPYHAYGARRNFPRRHIPQSKLYHNMRLSRLHGRLQIRQELSVSETTFAYQTFGSNVPTVRPSHRGRRSRIGRGDGQTQALQIVRGAASFQVKIEEIQEPILAFLQPLKMHRRQSRETPIADRRHDHERSTTIG